MSVGVVVCSVLVMTDYKSMRSLPAYDMDGGAACEFGIAFLAKTRKNVICSFLFSFVLL